MRVGSSSPVRLATLRYIYQAMSRVMYTKAARGTVSRRHQYVSGRAQRPGSALPESSAPESARPRKRVGDLPALAVRVGLLSRRGERERARERAWGNAQKKCGALSGMLVGLLAPDGGDGGCDDLGLDAALVVALFDAEVAAFAPVPARVLGKRSSREGF